MVAGTMVKYLPWAHTCALASPEDQGDGQEQKIYLWLPQDLSRSSIEVIIGGRNKDTCAFHHQEMQQGDRNSQHPVDDTNIPNSPRREPFCSDPSRGLKMNGNLNFHKSASPQHLLIKCNTLGLVCTWKQLETGVGRDRLQEHLEVVLYMLLSIGSF